MASWIFLIVMLLVAVLAISFNLYSRKSKKTALSNISISKHNTRHSATTDATHHHIEENSSSVDVDCGGGGGGGE